MEITGHDELDTYLSGPSIWSQFVHLEEVDSTNDEVARRVKDGAQAGLVVVSDHQTAGRGRGERDWQDVPGGNLNLSISMAHPGSSATLIPLAAGVAAGDALKRAGVKSKLKWPNDVLVDGRKIGGILAEAHDLRPHGPAFVVVGLGLDLDWRGHDRAGEAAEWTSVAEETGVDVDPWQLLTDLLRALASWLVDVTQDPTRLLAAYTVRCSTLERQVRVDTPGGVVEGEATEIDKTGGLVIHTAAGPEVVMAGDVQHVRPA